jgi:hypothetical protein
LTWNGIKTDHLIGAAAGGIETDHLIGAAAGGIEPDHGGYELHMSCIGFDGFDAARSSLSSSIQPHPQ